MTTTSSIVRSYGVRRQLRGARGTLVANLQAAAQYRTNMAAWAGSSLVQVIIYLAVWRAVAHAAGGTADGYTAAGFAGYFLVLLIVRDLTYTWMPWHFPDAVREGRLSPMLLRPQHPLVAYWGDIAAYRLQSTIILVPITVVLFVVFGASLEVTPIRVVAAILLMPLASLVRYLADCAIAITSFWVTRIDGIRGFYYVVMLILSGQFAPLSVLPPAARDVAYCLPFWWTLGLPVEIIDGHRALDVAWWGLAVQAGWAVLLFVVVRRIWRRGVRHHGAVGG